MQELDIQDLIKKFEAGTCTEEELNRLENWYLQWKPEALEANTERMEMLMAAAWKQMPVHAQAMPVRRSLWPKYAAAIALFLILGIGISYFLHQGASRSVYVNDVRPGHQGATLKLANGEVIELNGAKSGVVIGPAALRYDDGTAVSEIGAKPEGTELIATTAKGETYIITLPDGTRVWMNAATVLSFPSVFKGSSRRVSLQGEAYFEVAKDKAHPFLLNTEAQELTVLGTHFNVNGYPEDSRVTTTLLEGSVKITSAAAQEVLLRPGQQSSLDAKGMRVTPADTEEAIAWKNGYFRFNDLKIKEVMQRLARWYDIEVIYETGLTAEGFNGTISRFTTINDVLKMLEKTKTVHFKVEGRRVTVMQ